MEVSTIDFADAMDFVLSQVPKDSAEILNRAGLHAVIGGKGVRGAIQRTEQADRGKILAVTDAQLGKVVVKRAASKGERLTLSERKKRVKKERGRRLSSIAYTKGPGWHKAAKAMGGRGVRTQKGFEKSDAASGGGKKASAHALVAEIRNTAPAGEKIGFDPLNEAIDDVARDMVEHAAKKYGGTFAKVNAG